MAVAMPKRTRDARGVCGGGLWLRETLWESGFTWRLPHAWLQLVLERREAELDLTKKSGRN